jgi:hypothetical protein
MVGRMTRNVPGCGSWTATGMVCVQTSNAQELWIGPRGGRKGRTFPGDR